MHSGASQECVDLRTGEEVGRPIIGRTRTRLSSILTSPRSTGRDEADHDFAARSEGVLRLEQGGCRIGHETECQDEHYRSDPLTCNRQMFALPARRNASLNGESQGRLGGIDADLHAKRLRESPGANADL
jgi:hypothetical protein